MKYFGVRKKEKRSILLRFLSYYPVYGSVRNRFHFKSKIFSWSVL